MNAHLPVLLSLPLPAVPREGGGGGTIFLIQMVAVFAILYLLLIRPNAKREKARRQSIEAIKKGDEIVTNGGIIGQVVHVADGRLTVKTGESTRITVDQARVASVLNPTE